MYCKTLQIPKFFYTRTICTCNLLRLPPNKESKRSITVPVIAHGQHFSQSYRVDILELTQDSPLSNTRQLRVPLQQRADTAYCVSRAPRVS